MNAEPVQTWSIMHGQTRRKQLDGKPHLNNKTGATGLRAVCVHKCVRVGPVEGFDSVEHKDVKLTENFKTVLQVLQYLPTDQNHVLYSNLDKLVTRNCPFV